MRDEAKRYVLASGQPSKRELPQGRMLIYSISIDIVTM
jgi:hypothetical protein